MNYFTSGIISQREAVSILSDMKMDRGLYINDGKLYYVFEEEIEKVEIFDDPIILHPYDPIAHLIQRLYPQRINGFIVVKGDIVGVVKATVGRKIRVRDSTSDEAKKLFLHFF